MDLIMTSNLKALRRVKGVYWFVCGMFIFGVIGVILSYFIEKPQFSDFGIILTFGLIGFMAAMVYVTGSIAVGLKPIKLYKTQLILSKHKIADHLKFKSRVTIPLSDIKFVTYNKYKIPGYKNAYNDIILITTTNSEYRIESVVFGPLNELNTAIEAQIKTVNTFP
jgi:hypothetical protein